MEMLTSSEAWLALITLTFLEIVLGVDNIIFISIVTGKLPPDQRKRATQIGLFLAMFLRILLLLAVNVLVHMKNPWFILNIGFLKADITGQALVLVLGGIFLIYKSIYKENSISFLKSLFLSNQSHAKTHNTL